MPPKKEKEAIVVILDIGENTVKDDCSGRPFLEKAKDCLFKIIQKKLFTGSPDEFSLILLGSENTKNNLVKEDDVQNHYKYIEVVTSLSLPSWKLLSYVDNLTNSSRTGDWIDAIIVGIGQLVEEHQAKDFIRKNLVIFSNFNQEVCDDKIEVIIDNMKNVNINVTVIGEDILTDSNLDENNTPYSQVAGMRLINYVVEKLRGTICSFEDAYEQLMYFQRKSVRPTPWNVMLNISKNIKIPITGYKKTAEITKIKMSLESIDNKESLIHSETKYVKYDTESGSDVIVDQEKLIKGYEFCEVIIPFAVVEKQTMTYNSGPKGLYLLTCTPKTNVPYYMLLGDGSYLITCRKDDEDAQKALEAFVLALYTANKVAIVRKIYSDNNAPVIGALFPIVDEKHRYFIFAELPYKNDVNVYKFPSLSKVPPRTKEQSEAVGNLIDSMDLDETDDAPEKYELSSTYDPTEQYICNCIAYKALHPEEPLPDSLVDSVKHMLEPLPEIVNKSEEAVKMIKELFPLTVIEKKRKRDDSAKENGLLNEADNNETEIIEKVGLTHPEEDFSLMLKQGTYHLEACQSMQEAIIQLLTLFPDDIDKPLKALKTLRNNCVLENPKPYNNWMFDFKTFLMSRNIEKFWDSVIGENLGLITQDESIKSNVNADGAFQFLESQKNNSVPDNKFEISETVDDLWNDL